MTWPRDLGSPAVRAWSAILVRVAQTATPWVAGSRTEIRDMVSGAGRMVRCRSASAVRRRLTTAAGSMAMTSFWVSATRRRSPHPSKRVGPVGAGCADLGVHDAAVLAGQAGGLAGDEGGAPLGQGAGSHGGVGVGLLGQGLGEAEEPGAFRGGLAAGVADESGDVAALVGGRDPGGGVAVADGLVEADGQGGLSGGQRGLGVLERAEGVDQVALCRARCRRWRAVLTGPGARRRTRRGGGVGDELRGHAHHIEHVFE